MVTSILPEAYERKFLPDLPPTDLLENALQALKNQQPVVLINELENQGNLICAAEFASPEIINFMATQGRGLICLAMKGDRLDELDLPLMVEKNSNHRQKAFTISIDAAKHLGGTTGISAHDRALTIKTAISPNTIKSDLTRPGHIFPLRAKDGGVFERAEDTEAALDLARLAGLYPAAVLCEIHNSKGGMARIPELFAYAQTHQLKIVSIADVIHYRALKEPLVIREAIATMPTEFGNFLAYGYRHLLDKSEVIAIVKGDPQNFTDSVLVKIHSECLIADALGSLGCDCRTQLKQSLKLIESKGEGIVIYLKSKVQRLDLHCQLKVFSTPAPSLNPTFTNQELADKKDVSDQILAAQILQDLGVKNIHLLGNSTYNVSQLKPLVLNVVKNVSLSS